MAADIHYDRLLSPVLSINRMYINQRERDYLEEYHPQASCTKFYYGTVPQ